MGKATVISGGTDGDYTISLDYGSAARDARVAKMTAVIDAINATIAEIEAKIADQQIAEDAARDAAQAIEDAYIAKTKELQPAFTAAQAAESALIVAMGASYPNDDARAAAIAAAIATVEGTRAAYQAVIDALKTLLAAHTPALLAVVAEKKKSAGLQTQLDTAQANLVVAAREKARLLAMVLTETKQAWCADLTEDAAGSVATIEIPGESKLILLAPAAPAPLPADGALAAREMQSPEQVFWNAAVLPGWQKFKPTYRRGVITAINLTADTADVTLFAGDTSSAQNLAINPTATLSNVPIQYMTCNANAFEVGDNCVIKFTNFDWSQPKIVGFVNHPKACARGLHVWVSLNYLPVGALGMSSATASVTRRTLTRIYKLDITDPMDASKAKLVYSGGTDRVDDYTGTTDPYQTYLGAWIEHRTDVITAGEFNHAVRYATVMDEKLLLQVDQIESYAFTYYSGSPPGTPSAEVYSSNYWDTFTTTIHYAGRTAQIADRTETVAEFSTGVDSQTRTYTGLRAVSIPYHVSVNTSGADPVKNIHLIAKPANFDWSGERDSFNSLASQEYADAYDAANNARSQYTWTPGSAGFIADPNPDYLAVLPTTNVDSGTDYTPAQLGPRARGHNWVNIIQSMTSQAQNLRGVYYATATDDRVLGHMLSSVWYVAKNLDNTFQPKKLSDASHYSAQTLALADLPGLTSKAEFATMLAATGAFTFYMPIDFAFTTFQRYSVPSGDALIQNGTISAVFINDIGYQMDPLRTWPAA